MLFWGVSEQGCRTREKGLTALFGLARGRKYSNLVHLEHCVSTGQDVCILDRKYVILGCILRRMSSEVKGTYCTCLASRAEGNIVKQYTWSAVSVQNRLGVFWIGNMSIWGVF